MEVDGKFERTAHDYANLIAEIAVADRKAQKARSELDNLHEAKNRLALALKEFVGANIRRKATTIPGGMIVTIEYISDTSMPSIRVYENGQEVG